MVKTQNKRITYIDIARGVALIMVILTHASIGWWINDGKYQWITNFLMIGNLPVFFFLSGFLFRDYTWKKRISNTFNNLVIPYIFGSLVIFLLALFLHTGSRSALAGALYGNGGHDLTLFGNLMPIGAIWFFLALAVSTMFFSGLVKIISRLQIGELVQRCLILIISLIVFFLVVRTDFTSHYLLPFDLQSGALGISFLSVGYLFKYGYDYAPAQYAYLTKPYTFILFLLFWIFLSKNNVFYFVSAVVEGNVIQTLVAAIASIIVILNFSVWIDCNYGKCVAWIGRNSGMFMVTHDWVLIVLQVRFINQYLYFFHLNNYLGWSIAFAVIASLTFLIGSVLYPTKYINRIFFQRNWPIKVQ